MSISGGSNRIPGVLLDLNVHKVLATAATAAAADGFPRTLDIWRSPVPTCPGTKYPVRGIPHFDHGQIEGRHMKALVGFDDELYRIYDNILCVSADLSWWVAIETPIILNEIDS